MGSHLCERLLEKNTDVLCLDNFFSSEKDNIRHFFGHPYFEFIRHDIIHPFFAEIDAVFHLACPASPLYYQTNAIKTIKTNVMGTINMLGLAKRTGARILLASTSEVYGDPEVHPQPETYWGHVNPIGLRSCYDEGKRVAETLAMDYHRQNNVDIKIARLFNTYGPRMAVDDGRVVSNFIVQALKNQPLTIYGDGKQTRSFCYVDDLIDSLILFMRKDRFSGPVNLGNPHEYPILELARTIVELTGSRSEIMHKPSPPDDPVRRCPDITLAHQELKWAPKTSLTDGLARTISYFDKRLSRSAE